MSDFASKTRSWGGFFNRHKYIYATTILAYLFPAYEIKFVMTPLK